MKKAVILSIFIINSIICLGQNKTPLDNNATIDLPNESQKISKEQGLAHMQRIFKGNKTSNGSTRNDSFFMSDPKHAYKVGDILISLVTYNNAVPQDHLLKTKKSFDELFSANKTFNSVIKNVNNNPTLIFNYVSNETNYYYFFVHNQNYTKALNGKMAFESKDAKKAEALLNQILKSIAFK